MRAARQSPQQGIIRRAANSQCQARSRQSERASSHLPLGECGISKMHPTVQKKKKKMLVRDTTQIIRRHVFSSLLRLLIAKVYELNWKLERQGGTGRGGG